MNWPAHYVKQLNPLESETYGSMSSRSTHVAPMKVYKYFIFSYLRLAERVGFELSRIL